MRLGASWQTNPKFKEIFNRFHHVVEAAIVLAVIWYVASHWKNRIRTDAVEA